MKPQEIFPTGSNKQRDQKRPARPKRSTQRGPLGFGQVMHSAQSHAKRARGKSEHTGDTPPETAGNAGAFLPTGSATARRDEQHRDTARDIAGLSTAVLMPEALDHIALHAGVDTAATHQSQQASHLGTMTPQQALRTVLDEASKLDLERASKELHIELEPAHLGPIIVRISVERGRIRTELSAREENAATALRSGRTELRDRLAALGFASAEVTVEHDAELELGAPLA